MYPSRRDDEIVHVYLKRQLTRLVRSRADIGYPLKNILIQRTVSIFLCEEETVGLVGGRLPHAQGT